MDIQKFSNVLMNTSIEHIFLNRIHLTCAWNATDTTAAASVAHSNTSGRLRRLRIRHVSQHMTPLTWWGGFFEVLSRIPTL